MDPLSQHCESFRNQSYERLYAECREKRELFFDHEFPPTTQSLFSADPPAGFADSIEWKRVRDLCPSPKLFVGKVNPCRVVQGQMGNCWLVSAVGVLAAHQSLLDTVIPHRSYREFPDPKESKTSTSRHVNYKAYPASLISSDEDDDRSRSPRREKPNLDHPGIFEFKFFRFGTWYAVVVDEFLPTMHGNLIFGHSTNPNEFWPALLEKAYAKINGSYEALEEGSSEDALVDLTGCVPEHFDLREKVEEDTNFIEEFFRITYKAVRRGDLMSCSIEIENVEERETLTEDGLVLGHSYGIHDVLRVPASLLPREALPVHRGEMLFDDSSVPPASQRGSIGKADMPEAGLTSFSRKHVSDWFRQKNPYEVRLIRLRNPWGKSDWRGAWSEYSKEWRSLSSSLKKRLKLTVPRCGDFWIAYEEFIQQFTSVFICRMYNTSPWRINHQRWYTSSVFGRWSSKPPPYGDGRIPNTVGGCVNYHETFPNNPQYVFSVKQPKITMVVSLMQRDRRSERHKGQDNATIGFVVMRIEKNRKLRIHRAYPVKTVVKYVNSREIFHRFALNDGRYVLVPSTYEPGHESDFMLRVFTSHRVTMRELTSDRPAVDWLSAKLGSAYEGVLRIVVHSAQHIRTSGSCTSPFSYINPFVSLTSSDDKKWYLVGGYLPSDIHRTRTRYDTNSPTYVDEHFVFYIKDPEQARINIKLHSEGIFANTALGENYLKVSTFAKEGRKGRLSRINIPIFSSELAMREHEARWRAATGLKEPEEPPLERALVPTDPFSMYFAAWTNLEKAEAEATRREGQSVGSTAMQMTSDTVVAPTSFEATSLALALGIPERSDSVPPENVTTVTPASCERGQVINQTLRSCDLGPGKKAAVFAGALDPKAESCLTRRVAEVGTQTFNREAFRQRISTADDVRTEPAIKPQKGDNYRLSDAIHPARTAGHEDMKLNARNSHSRRPAPDSELMTARKFQGIDEQPIEMIDLGISSETGVEGSRLPDSCDYGSSAPTKVADASLSYVLKDAMHMASHCASRAECVSSFVQDPSSSYPSERPRQQALREYPPCRRVDECGSSLERTQQISRASSTQSHGIGMKKDIQEKSPQAGLLTAECRRLLINSPAAREELLEGTIVYHEETGLTIADPRGLVETGVPAPFSDTEDDLAMHSSDGDELDDALIPQDPQHVSEGLFTPGFVERTKRDQLSSLASAWRFSTAPPGQKSHGELNQRMVNILCPRTGKLVQVTQEQRELMMQEPLTDAYVISDNDGQQAALEAVKAAELKHRTLCPWYLEEIDARAMLTLYAVYEEGLRNA